MTDIEILRKAIRKMHPCDGVHAALNSVVSELDGFRAEIAELKATTIFVKKEDWEEMKREVARDCLNIVRHNSTREGMGLEIKAKHGV